MTSSPPDRPRALRPGGLRTRRPTRSGRWRGWWRGDRGSAEIELTLLTPVLIALLVLVAVVIHRGVDARLRLDDAAHQAARAASLQRSAPAAATAAHTTATTALDSAGVVCARLAVRADTTALVPGGLVSVTLTCRVDWSDAVPLGLPASRDLSATAREPVDTWRGVVATPTVGGTR